MAPIENAPSSSGSSYDEGWYGYVYKDLRTELGLPVDGPYSRRYCGNGSLRPAGRRCGRRSRRRPNT